MIEPTNKPQASSGPGLLALLIGTLSAAPLQLTLPATQPAITPTALAHTKLGHATLTPTSPVPSHVPASSREDIRHIRQPRPPPTPSLGLRSWSASSF